MNQERLERWIGDDDMLFGGVTQLSQRILDHRGAGYHWPGQGGSGREQKSSDLACIKFERDIENGVGTGDGLHSIPEAVHQRQVHFSEVERHCEAEVPGSAKLAVGTESCVTIFIWITVSSWIKFDGSNIRLLSGTDLGSCRGVKCEPRIISDHR